MENKGSIYNLNNLKHSTFLYSYYEHYYLAFDMCSHHHNTIEIMYVTLGEAVVEYINDKNETESLTIRSNEYVFIDSNVEHKIFINNIETRIYNLEFKFDEKILSSFPIYHTYETDSLFREMIKANERVFKAVDNGVILDNILLIQCYVEENENKNNIIDNRIEAMINLFLMCVANNYKDYKKKRLGANKINIATDYIFKNYSQDITLKDIADVCNVSENHLNFLFNSTFQMTVIAYLNQYRIKRACELIARDSMPLKQIMVEVGYQNKMSFNRNFIKYMKMSPSQYKTYKKKKSRMQNLRDDIQITYQ